MKTRGLIWGFVLVCLGLLLLLDQLGILPDDINIWGLFFAVLLISVGFRWVFSASVAHKNFSKQISIPCEEVPKVSVRFDYGAGELIVKAGDTNVRSIEGCFSESVEYSSKTIEEIQYIQLAAPNFNWWEVPFWEGKHRHWDVSLPQGVLLNLTFNTGANSSVIDLHNLLIKELTMNTGASSSVITMPEASGNTIAVIKAGAASVEVRIPESVAARIQISSGAAGVNINTHRFNRIGAMYETPGFESFEDRLELRLECGAGSLHVH